MTINHSPLLRAEVRINKIHMKHSIQVLLNPCMSSLLQPCLCEPSCNPVTEQEIESGSQERWDKGQNRGLPVPGSGTGIFILSTFLR